MIFALLASFLLGFLIRHFIFSSVSVPVALWLFRFLAFLFLVLLCAVLVHLDVSYWLAIPLQAILCVFYFAYEHKFHSALVS